MYEPYLTESAGTPDERRRRQLHQNECAIHCGSLVDLLAMSTGKWQVFKRRNIHAL